MVQTAIAEPVLRKGQIVEGFWTNQIISRACEGALAAGNVVVYGTDRETQVAELSALPVADVDAIATAAVIASAVTAQSIGAGTFDGIIGRDRIHPARVITVNFSASADWDTPSGECRVDVYGVDAMGAIIKDTVSRPNSGAVAVAVATEKPFAAVTQLDIEACNGVGGTATVGVANDRVEIPRSFCPGLAVYQPIKEPNTTAREFADNEDVAVLIRGRIASQTEHAVSVGDDVYVRVLAAGADLRGQLTGMDGADTPATYARLPGARWVTAAAVDGIAVVEIG